MVYEENSSNILIVLDVHLGALKSEYNLFIFP